MSELLEAIQAAPVRADELSREGELVYVEICTYPPPQTQQEAEIYAARLQEVKAALAFIEAEKVKVTRPQREALNAALAHFKRAASPYESAELVLKGHLGLWEIARRKEAEQAQRDAEAAAQAERDRLRAQAEAKEREAMAAAHDAPEAALALVQSALDLRQEAQSTVAPLVAAPAKIAGISMRGTWKLAVVSEASMREYVHTHPEFRGLFPYDPKAGDALARTLKDRLNIPGAEVKFVPVVAAGRK